MEQKGFTFIELVFTMAIIAILASVIIPLSQMTVKRDKEIVLKRNLRLIRTAIDNYKEAVDEGRIEKKADESGYPPTLMILIEGVPEKLVLGGGSKRGSVGNQAGAGGLVRGGSGKGRSVATGSLDSKSATPKILKFLRRIPRDPMSKDLSIASEESWGLRSYESDYDNPEEGEDVFDVYSLSEEIAIDGTQYNTW
ncbi:MAG: type II secretion system protein [Deltaproteobacteria bacterium]|nr:type II secretion system protein [Deltaproteobacteria bacterium]